MPRYRFRWDNLPPDLLDALAAGLHLDVNAPAEALHDRYGARPHAELVADAWPVLRDHWLAHDDANRSEVVDALWVRHLGDRTIDVSTADGQTAYLHTCRNQAHLRAVVLAQLVHLGENPARVLKRRAVAGAGGEWGEFAEHLAGALAVLEAGQCLVVSVRASGDGRPVTRTGSQRYVQVAVDRDGAARAEAVSNAYLNRHDRLTDDAVARLATLGWHAPTHAPDDPDGERDEHGSANHFVDLAAPVPWTRVADLAATTLRDVYGVARPGFLQYSSFDHDGNRILLPTLGLTPEPPAPGIDPDRIEEELPDPRSPGELQDAVETTLRPLLSDGGLVTDEDGDIVIGWGGARLYVRVLEDAPIVRVLTFVLSDVEASPALSEALNDIHLEYPYVRAILADDTVVLSIDVNGTPYVGWHLIEAIARLGTAADEVQEELEHRFGVPPLPPGTGGYL